MKLICSDNQLIYRKNHIRTKVVNLSLAQEAFSEVSKAPRRQDSFYLRFC